MQAQQGRCPSSPHTYVFFLLIYIFVFTVFLHNWEGQVTVGGAPAKTGQPPAQAKRGEHQLGPAREQSKAGGSTTAATRSAAPGDGEFRSPARTGQMTMGSHCGQGGFTGSHLQQRLRRSTSSGAASLCNNHSRVTCRPETFFIRYIRLHNYQVVV